MSFFVTAGQRLPAWARGGGEHGDIVLGTRACLRRNVTEEPFPGNASPRDRRRLAADLVLLVGARPAFAEGWSVTLSAATEAELRCLREKHLLGPRAAVDEGRVLMLAPDLELTVQIQQEDHLHLHAWRPGLDPAATLAAVLDLDEQLEQDITPAYSENLGYLTARPGHVGTGLTMSALMHLPGLVYSGEIDKVLNALGQLQYAVTGLYGTGSTVRGALFVVSNLVTLGREEEEIAADFRTNIEKLVTYEMMAREQLEQRDAANLADLAWRSLAVLRHARLVSSQEAWDRLSNVRLGVDRGTLPPLAPALLNRAMIGCRTGHLELGAGAPLDADRRAAARASFLRELFAE
ncbi:hypothetical protein DRQ50_10555 [bacterium]|nr:MAG: hypothetical protein DRQ50_10555 [bacterium]